MNDRTAWMSGRYGVMSHWLFPGVLPERGQPASSLDQAVEAFDLARTLEDFAASGAEWYLFTLGQNTGCYASPNAVIETLADVAPRSQDPEVLTAQVRTALGRSIVQELYPGGAEMQVMSLDPQLERLLLQAVAGGGDGAGIEPGLADTLVREAVIAAQRQEEVGLPVVLLVPGNLRTLLSRFLRRSISQLKVLAHAEVPESRIIKVTSIIGQRA